MRIAVIDLGTNTWNLVVAEPLADKTFNILWDEKLPVKLAKGGMKNKIILPDAVARGLQALEKHLTTIRRYKADHLRIIATSAFRTAANGPEFAQKIYERSGTMVEIIPGKREAELIFKGIRASVQLSDEPVMVLDIGGGSNEFIIGNQHSIFLKKSYKLGIARLLEHFPVSDPIQPEEIREFERHFTITMDDLIREFPTYRVGTLIGAAGTFETFASMLYHREGKMYQKTEKKACLDIYLPHYYALHKDLINSTTQQRMQMAGLEPMRIEMIVLASVFVNYVLKTFSFTHLVQSDYSLKEGVVAEMLEGLSK